MSSCLHWLRSMLALGFGSLWAVFTACLAWTTPWLPSKRGRFTSAALDAAADKYLPDAWHLGSDGIPMRYISINQGPNRAERRARLGGCLRGYLRRLYRFELREKARKFRAAARPTAAA